MTKSEDLFIRLFKDAYKKFSEEGLNSSLSEAESKLFCNDIEEKTGLVIGFKSVKNYSIYVLNPLARKENPSTATLDTLARYVLKAPPTSETERKRNEGHYPYWHLYRKHQNTAKKSRKPYYIIFAVGILGIVVWLALDNYDASGRQTFQDNFESTDQQTLKKNAWHLLNQDREYWSKRDEKEGYLTLFTLRGDNWPDTLKTEKIKNLLVRKVDATCFDTEIHMEGFLPGERWHQAGVLFLEDTSFTGRALRLSIAFNDFFGGFSGTPEIILQGISLFNQSNPEEFLHHQLFELDSASQPIIRDYLKYSNLRVEKRNNQFRFLIATGPFTNNAYKEIGVHKFDMDINYIGLFAIKGNVADAKTLAVHFDSFYFEGISCRD